jgi:prepilin-type N-terminal cleavage/methylation domain-containing protein
MHSRGFTLIEILIVVVILALIAGFVVPQFQRAVQRQQFNTLYLDYLKFNSTFALWTQRNGNFPTIARTSAANFFNNNATFNGFPFPPDPSGYSYDVSSSNAINDYAVFITSGGAAFANFGPGGFTGYNADFGNFLLTRGCHVVGAVMVCN